MIYGRRVQYTVYHISLSTQCLRLAEVPYNLGGVTGPAGGGGGGGSGSRMNNNLSGMYSTIGRINPWYSTHGG